MKRISVLLLLALTLASCGTDRHVEGRVTDTNTWSTVFCTYSKKGGTHCYPEIHHSFVVAGHSYRDDGDDVRVGDYVSFTDNSIWGVQDMHDSTIHHDDYTWIWVVILIVFFVGAGAMVFSRNRR